MVLLATTPAMAAAQQAEHPGRTPAIDSPISHTQLLDLWRRAATSDAPPTLDSLLRGSRVLAPTPARPPPAPTAEYTALMAQLRLAADARAYEQLRGAASPGAARAPAEATTRAAVREVQQQLALVLNVLLSAAGVGGALWAVARWWSAGARLALAGGGAIAVAVAEVVVYAAWERRAADVAARRVLRPERRHVVATWELGATAGAPDKPTAAASAQSPPASGSASGLRSRHPARQLEPEPDP